MVDYEPVELHAFYRASHSSVWRVAEHAGILHELAITLASLEPCTSSAVAEAALNDGSVDFVSGNHISPYAEVARGSPIVCLASPKNSVKDTLIATKPVRSLAELAGSRVADGPIHDARGGYHHSRGNHMLYLKQAGLDIAKDVEWVEIHEADRMAGQLDAFRAGRIDATFAVGPVEDYVSAGCHVLELESLPMINGPTITTSLIALQRHERLGERLVMALVRAIHFARSQPAQLAEVLESNGYGSRASCEALVKRVAGYLRKPYPEIQAVANAYELCCMQYQETSNVSPLALWDTHYLRELDNSGFIDGLYAS